MGLEVRRAISLYKNHFITESQLFQNLIDLAVANNVDQVLTRIPSGYLVRFRDWLKRQPPVEAMLDLRSGPPPKRDREAVAAIREWLDRHAGADGIPPQVRVASPRLTSATSIQASDEWTLPAPAGLEWIGEMTPVGPFTHRWPNHDVEHYHSAFEGAISLQLKIMDVKIGECVRHERNGLTVFFDRDPISEFMETRDRQGWASIIKPDGKRALGVSESPPSLYAGARMAKYQAVTGLRGRGVPTGMAVVIRKGDPRSLVHHAAARWLARNALPVETQGFRQPRSGPRG